MAQVTRAQLLSDIRQFADAAATGRWSDSLVLAVADSVFDGEWSHILSAAPYYRAASRSVTTDANGQFQLSSLNSGTGNSAQRLYRIISITDGNERLYDETRFQDVPFGTTNPRYAYGGDLYYLMGETVQVLPADAGLSLAVTVNYKPPVPSALSADNATVDFPDDSHLVIAWEAAAILLLKGGAEANAASVLMDLARQSRERMLGDIQRRTARPVRVMPLDDAADWGSH